MIGYQIAFDLYESATQHFLRKVQETIRGSLPAPPTATPTTADANGATSSVTTEESSQAVASTPVQESGIMMTPYPAVHCLQEFLGGVPSEPPTLRI